MADIRSLLRSELAARKGSPQTGSTANRVTKKRKVDPTETLTRKKVRHTSATPDQLLAHAQIQPPSAQAIAEEEEEEEQTNQHITRIQPPSVTDVGSEAAIATAQLSQAQPTLPNEPTANPQDVDEDEWAAFEREVVAPTRVAYRPAAVTAAATISAPPISSEELAALQQRENETARPNREAEAEGEREDAARFMEEEFDEMEQLEERVRRLKHMREQLRVKRPMEGVEEPPSADALAAEQLANQTTGKDFDEKEEDDDDDDDIDDDWDNWRFR